MIILLKKDAEQSQVDNLLTLLRMKNITPSAPTSVSVQMIRFSGP